MTAGYHTRGTHPAPIPLHVELILGSARIGGTERQVVRLAHELRTLGVTVSIVVLEGVGPLFDDLDALAALDIAVSVVGFGGISPSRIPGIPTGNSLRGLWRLTRHRRPAGRPDVSHAFLDGAIAIAPLLGALTRPGRTRARPRHHIAGIRGRRHGGPGTRRRLARQIRRADAVVCNAPHLAQEIIALGADPQRVRVIANGVDLPATVADPADLTGRVTAVMVANFHAYKGHADVVHAVALLPVAVRPVVRLCGTGPDRDAVEQLVTELGVGEWVQLVDPPADVPAELAAAQFAVHASHTEGMSNAILEQLAHGLPVIACRVGGNAVLVADGVNGLLVPPADPGALAAAIATLTTDADLRVRMGAAARAGAERFSWRACTRAHLELYHAVSEQGRP
jgi:glycosyltransferase involved in cell wall biosynthesis